MNVESVWSKCLLSASFLPIFTVVSLRIFFHLRCVSFLIGDLALAQRSCEEYTVSCVIKSDECVSVRSPARFHVRLALGLSNENWLRIKSLIMSFQPHHEADWSLAAFYEMLFHSNDLRKLLSSPWERTVERLQSSSRIFVWEDSDLL